MESTVKRAVVLLSGGLDSATVLAIARSQGYELYALSFSYGQRHVIELEAARRVAAAIGVAAHRIAAIDLRIFGGSALTGDFAVPKGRDADAMSHGIPITYVPARNTIFLSFALAWAEVLGSSDIFIGVNALDYSGYPDCRPEFIEAFETDGQSGHQSRCRRTPASHGSHAVDCVHQGPDHRQGDRTRRDLVAGVDALVRGGGGGGGGGGNGSAPVTWQ